VDFVVCALAVKKKKIRAGFDMSDQTIPLWVPIPFSNRLNSYHGNIRVILNASLVNLQDSFAPCTQPRFNCTPYVSYSAIIWQHSCYSVVTWTIGAE
jgi:hypothetical protein